MTSPAHTANHPLSVTEHEAPWLESWGRNTRRVLLRELASLDVPSPIMLGLVGWLEVKHLGEGDPTSSPTRARYRKILAEINAQGGEPPGDNRRRRSRDEVGVGQVTLLGTVAGVAGSGMAAYQHPAVAAALVGGISALLYITSNPPEGVKELAGTAEIVPFDARRMRTVRPAMRVGSVLAA